MSVSYCSGGRSSFTDANNYTIDNLVEMFELSPSDVVDVQTWKMLKAIDEDKRTVEQQAQFVELSTALAQKLVTSEDWNKLCDCIVNLQKMYVNKGLNRINQSIENYIAEYVAYQANTDVDEAVGDRVNNLLESADLTKIIVSTTQPAVVNGGLWLKPQTN